jgi:hypothetical protein
LPSAGHELHGRIRLGHDTKSDGLWQEEMARAPSRGFFVACLQRRCAGLADLEDTDVETGLDVFYRPTGNTVIDRPINPDVLQTCVQCGIRSLAAFKAFPQVGKVSRNNSRSYSLICLTSS